MDKNYEHVNEKKKKWQCISVCIPSVTQSFLESNKKLSCENYMLGRMNLGTTYRRVLKRKKKKVREKKENINYQ